jgi:hypothetical protein
MVVLARLVDKEKRHAVADLDGVAAVGNVLRRGERLVAMSL